MELMVAWVASSGGVDGFVGVDGGGFDDVDGGMVASLASMVAWWRRWRRLVASIGGNWGLRHRGR